MTENFKNGSQSIRVPSKAKYFWGGFLIGILIAPLQFFFAASFRSGLIYPGPAHNWPLIIVCVFPILWLGTFLCIKLRRHHNYRAEYFILGLLMPGTLLNITLVLLT